ncbi:MAG: serine hydrolase domain-containing protein [Candidatus Kapaibacteriota bacterium]
MTLSAQSNFNFQADIESQLHENIPGVLLTVISKEKEIDWSGASGYTDKVHNNKLLPHQTFRMASVTKTFVASTILRLWEDQKLKLEDPIIQYISKEHSELLIKGGYAPDKITILHLLTHSSGMADHTHTERFQFEYIKTNHTWTRTEQLMELIHHTKPVGEIGKQFSYSDTGYILLGEIIENITQKSLGEAIEMLLDFHKLGLHSIHIEDKKGEFTADRIHQYHMDGEDIYFINPTFDLYGGGGLLSSTHDLALFFKNLFEHKVFRKKSTLERMLTPINYSEIPALDYRMGIWETDIEGVKAYTHSGFWGTQVIYIPNIQTTIAVNYSQWWGKKGVAPIIPIIVKRLLNK